MSESIPVMPAVPATPVAAPPPEAPAQAKRDGHGVTIARNSLWLLVDNAAATAASFYCSIVASRALGPDRMGDYNYVLRRKSGGEKLKLKKYSPRLRKHTTHVEKKK